VRQQQQRRAGRQRRQHAFEVTKVTREGIHRRPLAGGGMTLPTPVEAPYLETARTQPGGDLGVLLQELRQALQQQHPAARRSRPPVTAAQAGAVVGE
jgi:hypothetical protein